MARLDEMFAADSGVVHDVHFLTRGDVAFYTQGAELDNGRRPWTDQDQPPPGELHNLQHRQLRIVVLTAP